MAPEKGPKDRVLEAGVFAIIQSGGHQVKVTEGSVVDVDRFDANPGDEVSIDQVLLLERGDGAVLTGTPFVANARVIGVVQGPSRGPKIRIFKKKRRKGMRRSRGHRSTYMRVVIREVLVS
ncbi:MAG: 50S ribosomal protein L21 [Vicinamibacterales bacterium]